MSTVTLAEEAVEWDDPILVTLRNIHDRMSELAKHEHLSPETAKIATLYVLGTLPEQERSDFERHLVDGCPVCISEVERVTAILSALAESSAPALPSGMRQRFQARLKKEQDHLATDACGEGILLSKSGVLIERPEAMQWHAGPLSGMWVKPLFADKQQQRFTSLVRMEPGTRYPSHRHNGAEEIFLLEGDFVIEGLVMHAGDYCNAEPASVHDESFTKAGCLFLLNACSLDEILS
jgi:anti-sigma factor ChrR (cupin superfamily)